MAISAVMVDQNKDESFTAYQYIITGSFDDARDARRGRRWPASLESRQRGTALKQPLHWFQGDNAMGGTHVLVAARMVLSSWNREADRVALRIVPEPFAEF